MKRARLHEHWRYHLKVEVRLFAALARYLPPGSVGKRAMLELPEGATVGDLARRLGLADVPATALVNGHSRHHATILRDGDVVSFFPPLGGG